MEDHECIQRCLNGSSESFRHLVERYQSPLLSFLLGKLHNWEDAEEAAQESFVRAFVSLGTLRKHGSFFPWLLSIGSRVVKEKWRSEKRRSQIKKGLSEKPPEPEISNDYDLEGAIAKLSRPYQEVILLRYYKGMTCAQVGEHLGISTGTVTKRLSRVYAMLRSLLRQCDQEK